MLNYWSERPIQLGILFFPECRVALNFLQSGDYLEYSFSVKENKAEVVKLAKYSICHSTFPSFFHFAGTIFWPMN